MYIKTLIVFLVALTIGVFNVQADIGEVKIAQNNFSSQNTGTVSGTDYKIYCPSEYNIVRFGWQGKINSSTQTLGYYFNNLWHSSSTLSTTQTWKFFTLNIPCDEVNGVPFEIISPVNYYSYSATYSIGTSWELPQVYVANITSGTYNSFLLELKLPLTQGNASSSSMGSATTTILSSNDGIISFTALYIVFFITITLGLLLFIPFFYVRK